MLTPEEIRAMLGEAFYPHLKERARKRKNGGATREELEEYRFMWDQVDDRKRDRLRNDVEMNKTSEESSGCLR